MIFSWIREHLWMMALIVIAVTFNWGYPYPIFDGCCCGITIPADACCPTTALPTNLTVTITLINNCGNVHNCANNGLTIPISWNASSLTWTGSVPFGTCGPSIIASFYCHASTNKYWIDFSFDDTCNIAASGPCGNNVSSTGLGNTCTPFIWHFVFACSVFGCCIDPLAGQIQNCVVTAWLACFVKHRLQSLIQLRVSVSQKNFRLSAVVMVIASRHHIFIIYVRTAPIIENYGTTGLGVCV